MIGWTIAIGCTKIEVLEGHSLINSCSSHCTCMSVGEHNEHESLLFDDKYNIHMRSKNHKANGCGHTLEFAIILH